MHDRAAQGLAKLALEPEWEARFEPNSFGFRPGRSCQDAIAQIFEIIKHTPRYVLDADIASCFDRIDQKALLDKINTSPRFARPIREWLKAGAVENGLVMPTEAGTPQGGVITPPIKLQTFFFGAGLPRICINSKDNIHAVRGHLHPLDQGTNHLAFAKPVRVLQPRINLGRKVLQASNDQTNFRLKSRHIDELLTLLLQLRETLAQAGNAGFELVLSQ